METPSPLPHLISFHFLLSILLFSASGYTSAVDFIRSRCNATLYPDLCYTSLSPYASTVQQNPAQLARVAVGVSLSHARLVTSFVSNLTRSPSSSALRDCSSTLRDAVNEIRLSLGQMRQLDSPYGSGYEGWRLQVSNVQTWMSAAVTNEGTCADGFGEEAEESSVKAEVCRRVSVASEFASNALALVNSYAATFLRG